MALVELDILDAKIYIYQFKLVKRRGLPESLKYLSYCLQLLYVLYHQYLK